MRDGEMAEEVKVGALLPMMTAEGFRIEGKVIEIADKNQDGLQSSVCRNDCEI